MAAMQALMRRSAKEEGGGIRWIVQVSVRKARERVPWVPLGGGGGGRKAVT